MKELKPTRELLSAYYISVLFSTLLLRLNSVREFVLNFSDVFKTVLQKTLSEKTAEWLTWFSLFLVCFLLVFLIKRYVVEPINLHMSDENNVNSFETFLFIFVVLGALVYYINDYFKIPMPLVVPEALRNLFGDVYSSNSSRDLAEVIWNIAPLVMLILIIRSKGAGSSGGSDSGHH